VRAYKKPGRPPCGIDGCERPLYCKGLCVMHYSRVRLGIADLRPDPLRAPPGSGFVNEYGYRVRRDPSHPLAGAQGKVLEHRAVLYSVIGGGEHRCHWCSKRLTWRGPAGSRINADHLDFDKLNNEPSNLVPSCLDCNTKRRQHPHVPVISKPKPYVLTAAQREAARQRAKAWYRANREYVLRRQRERRQVKKRKVDYV
jgi:hypothetical protein